jgi:DHA1 family L-arabinose/isopropyl-beta-D-thiogalactopyranoside export protein-like MFS transporter
VVRAPLSLLAALVLCSFADELVTYWPFGGLEPIRASLGLSYAEMGLAVGSLTAGGLLGHFFRVAADFVPLRWLSSLGAAGVAAGMLAFGLGNSLPVLVAGGFVWGASTDAFFSGCEVALIGLLTEDDVPAALGRVNAYGSAGDLLGPLVLAATLAAGLSWRVVFVAGAVLMLAYAAALACQTFPPRQIEPPEPAMTAVWSVLRDPRVLALGVIDGLHGLLDEPLLGFFNAFLERDRGWTESLATVLVSLILGAGLIGYLAVPLFTRRMTSRQLLPFFGAVMAAALVVLVFVPISWVAPLAAAAFGLAGAVFYATLEATYLSLRPGQAGTTGAVVSAISLLGIGFPALVGAVSDAHGLTAGMAVYAGVPVLMLSLVIVSARRKDW